MSRCASGSFLRSGAVEPADSWDDGGCGNFREEGGMALSMRGKAAIQLRPASHPIRSVPCPTTTPEDHPCERSGESTSTTASVKATRATACTAATQRYSCLAGEVHPPSGTRIELRHDPDARRPRSKPDLMTFLMTNAPASHRRPQKDRLQGMGSRGFSRVVQHLLNAR